jgi:hypothetical protein
MAMGRGVRRHQSRMRPRRRADVPEWHSPCSDCKEEGQHAGVLGSDPHAGEHAMVLILLWLLGVPLGLIIILFLLGVGH